MSDRRRSAGFTLIELIIVLVLMTIIGATVALFVKPTIDAYSDTRNRVVLGDMGDTALRRMVRDIRVAVPNSLRVSADGQAVELLLIHSAARYRPNRVGEQGLRFSSDAAGTCNSTTQGGRCDSLQVLDGAFNPAGARWLVLYNIGAESGGSPQQGSNVWKYGNPGVITPTGTRSVAVSVTVKLSTP